MMPVRLGCASTRHRAAFFLRHTRLALEKCASLGVPLDSIVAPCDEPLLLGTVPPLPLGIGCLLDLHQGQGLWVDPIPFASGESRGFQSNCLQLGNVMPMPSGHIDSAAEGIALGSRDASSDRIRRFPPRALAATLRYAAKVESRM